MSVINNNLLLTADAGGSQYQISRSLRFNTPDSAYANRTFSTPTTQGTFTLAMWVKRAALGTAQSLFGVSTNHSFGFTTGNALNLTFGGTSALTTTAVFRDTSAWYHIVWTQSDTSHTVYVNGTSQGTATATSSVFNTAVAHQVGASNTTNYFNGYLADVHFIDGQALTPSSFTETNATTGQLVPKAYTGTYGTNGFRLNFSNNSAATLYTLGADSRTDGALNGNNGTLVNGPTYNSANGGSIVFDGTNDYVDTGKTATQLGIYDADYTCEAWVYPTNLSGDKPMFGTAQDFTRQGLHLVFRNGTILQGHYFADFSAGTVSVNTWNNICFTYVKSTGIASIYKNGVLQGSGSIASFIGTTNILLGRWSAAFSNYFTGNGSNYKIYNRALSASEVTQNYNALVGRFGGTSTGSTVTNGMVLNLDAGNTASYPGTGTTWTDISLRKNNWTPNNLSVTAGAGNDSLTDTPTSYGTDTGAGGEVRGNYATLNPLEVPVRGTTANGNLEYTSTGSNTGLEHRTATIRKLSSGKWYFECNVTGLSGSGDPFIGWVNNNFVINVTNPDGSSNSWAIAGGQVLGGSTNNCVIRNGATNTVVFTGAAPYLLMIAIDIDAGKIWFGKDGTWAQSGNPATATNPQFTNLTNGPYSPLFRGTGGSGGTSTLIANFGQRPFAYAAPSGFKALCDTNLPTPTIAKGSSVFDATLYTGTGAALTPTSSLAFSPDLVWIKGRFGATDHALYDTVRGATLDLVSNSTAAETTQTQGLTAFNSNGFSVGTLAKLNTSAATYAGWAWDAGSSTVTNTAGTITSQVRANASAGFSIVTGAYFAGTLGHGLGVAPAMVIAKQRNTANFWYTYHKDAIASGTVANNSFLTLDSSSAVGNFGQNLWNVTSTTISSNLGLSGTAVFYCFAPVTGYSSFGSYTGNGSADGPFVYLGFRPAFLMMKRTNSTGNWVMLDSKREGYNVDNDPLYANLANVEGTDDLADITSNGFKLRSTNADCNASGGTYIYAAFAENPFQYARAR